MRGCQLGHVERDGSSDWIYRLLIRVREMPAAGSNLGPLRKCDQDLGWDPGGPESEPCQARTDDAPTPKDIQPIRPSCCSLPTHNPLSLQDVRRNQAACLAHTSGVPRRNHLPRVGLSSFSFLPPNSPRPSVPPFLSLAAGSTHSTESPTCSPTRACSPLFFPSSSPQSSFRSPSSSLPSSFSTSPKPPSSPSSS